MTMTINHVIYLTASILITVVVAHVLHKHGRLFLIDVFGGNVSIADAVNRLLVVGFFLLNIALVTLAAKLGGIAIGLEPSIELLSTKIGWVLFVLGCMHFFNVIVLSHLRRRKLSEPMEIVEFLSH